MSWTSCRGGAERDGRVWLTATMMLTLLAACAFAFPARAAAGYVQSEEALTCPTFPFTGHEFAGPALSGDGTTAAVGGCVFTRTGEAWEEEADLGGEPVDLALSADGNVLLAGSKTGTLAYIRAAKGVWNSSALDAPDGPQVAVSGDGSIAVTAGGTVYARSGEAWTRRLQLNEPRHGMHSKPLSAGPVALSGDGKVLLIAWPGWKGKGEVEAYEGTDEGGAWQTAPPLRVKGKAKAFGDALAVSADGMTAVVGATASKGFPRGSVYVFARSGREWSEQAALGPGRRSTPDPGARFGESVALTSDGNTLLVGERTPQGGVVRVFERSSQQWAETEVLQPRIAREQTCFGCMVGLSESGDTALIGQVSSAPSEEEEATIWTQ